VEKFSNHGDGGCGELSSGVRASPSADGEATWPPTLPHHGHHTCQKSALILRLLRQKARARRNTKPQRFYSIRAVASHFGVPATTVSRIYTQLRSEGLLTTVWGSKTFVTPVHIDNELRVRAVVALPASLTSFCTLRDYRNFFIEMRDALWKCGFATRLLFFEGNDAHSPSFAELLLSYKPDIVIWFQPVPNLKGMLARLLDCGIRVITVGDCPVDYREYRYCISRGRATEDALFSWQRDGIRSVIVLQDSHCGPANTVALVERCLRDTAIPHGFANAESSQLQDPLPAYGQRVKQGIIFSSSELAVGLAARDPARFAKFLNQSRVLLMGGPIDVPGSYTIKASIDSVEMDTQSVAKRITSDLIQSTTSRNAEPVIFHAKWVPRPNNNPLNARLR
jgi:hypothetical protein